MIDHMITNYLSKGIFLTGISALQAGTISLVPLTDDASSGISTGNTYTHAISGGNSATVNGVVFESLTSGLTPANFNWDTGADGKNQIPANNGDWNPTAGGVTGPGIQSLLSGFTYSGSGANLPSSQTYSLTGLNVGSTYDTRLYIRVWDTDGSGRPLDLSFTHGAESDSGGTVPEDRPSLALGGGNDQQAYYVNYQFTAQAEQLDITAAVSASGGANSGSAHMYALSNQLVVPEPSSIILLSFGLLGILRRRRS